MGKLVPQKVIDLAHGNLGLLAPCEFQLRTPGGGFTTTLLIEALMEYLQGAKILLVGTDPMAMWENLRGMAKRIQPDCWNKHKPVLLREEDFMRHDEVYRYGLLTQFRTFRDHGDTKPNEIIATIRRLRRRDDLWVALDRDGMEVVTLTDQGAWDLALDARFPVFVEDTLEKPQVLPPPPPPEPVFKDVDLIGTMEVEGESQILSTDMLTLPTFTYEPPPLMFTIDDGQGNTVEFDFSDAQAIKGLINRVAQLERRLAELEGGGE